MTALDPQAILDSAAHGTPEPLARRVRGLSDRALAWLFITPTIVLLLLAINIFPLLWTTSALVHELPRQSDQCGRVGRGHRQLRRRC